MSDGWSEDDKKAKELSEENFSWESGKSDNSFTDKEKQKLKMMCPEKEYSPTYKS